MKIAIITETYPPQINGVSRTLGRLVEHLAAHGHDVLVVHPFYHELQQPDPVTDRPANVQVLMLKAWPLPFYHEVVMPKPPFGAYKTALDQFQPDLVHIATEGPLGLSALHFCRKRRWKVVSSFHTNFDAYAKHYNASWAVPLVARYLRWFHNRTLATFVPSPTLISHLESAGFERLRLWPRGVETSIFKPARPGAIRLRESLGIAPGTIVVGHSGRLAPEKNTDYLVGAFAELLCQNLAIHLLIVGDGPSRTAFEPLADAYTAMNLFAFASRTETFGNVLLEAMASGLPVAALAEGGPVDVVQNGQTGRLLPANAPPAMMAQVLLEWVDDANMRQTLAAQARSYAESQTWQGIMGRLMDDYVEIVAKT